MKKRRKLSAAIMFLIGIGGVTSLFYESKDFLMGFAVKPSSEEAIRRIINKYILLASEERYEELGELVTAPPQSFITQSREYFNLRMKAESQKLSNNGQENGPVANLPSKNPSANILDEVYFNFIVKQEPRFVTKNGLRFDKIIEINTYDDYSRIRVGYLQDQQPSVFQQTFYLTKDDTNEWRIFKINF
jgi:hypothetical protein